MSTARQHFTTDAPPKDFLPKALRATQWRFHPVNQITAQNALFRSWSTENLWCVLAYSNASSGGDKRFPHVSTTKCRTAEEKEASRPCHLEDARRETKAEAGKKYSYVEKAWQKVEAYRRDGSVTGLTAGDWHAEKEPAHSNV